MKKVLIGLVFIMFGIGTAIAADNQSMTTSATNASAKPLAANDIIVKTPHIQLMQNNANSAEAFMELDNKSNTPVALIAANSMTAHQTLLHKFVKRNGELTMKKVNKIVIRPHSDTELQPGGFHVMLLGLKQALQKGDSVPILLIFEDGSSITIHATVS